MDWTLAKALWCAPLPDPEAPGAALLREIEAGLAYRPLLDQLRQLVRHGLPAAPALERALNAHPASIDLALIAVRAETPGAIDALSQRVAAQNRRYAALAWTLWARGEADAARAALETLDPASDTHAGDRAARAELAILSGEDPGPLEGPRAAHLSLMRLYRRHGAAALAQRLDQSADSLPADPSLWVWLIDVFIHERDYIRARACLGRLAAHHGGAHHVVRAQRIRLALDTEALGCARRLLDAEDAPGEPWTWPAQRLAQHLRCLIEEHALDGTPGTLRSTAEAIGRIEPGHGVLAHLRLTAQILTQPWDALARSARDPVRAPGAAAALFARLGLPDNALTALDAQPAAPPDARARTRLRRAELMVMRGDLAGAERALGPPPVDHAHKPGDAYWRSELALARRETANALAILEPALATTPTQMGLWLNLSRARYMAGDFRAAQAALERFRTLKTAQLGSPPPDDLRDRITADALAAQAGGRSDTVSPGLAARTLALATPRFTPVSDARIPHRLAHYWEGPAPDPVQRGLRAWAARHPGFDQRLFDAATAAVWLARHAPNLSDLFARQTQPAARADLFRLAWISHEGGLFADLDEYPRASVADWLDSARAVLVIEQGFGTVANNFLAAEPGLPLFERALEAVTRALHSTDAPYPWWHSGPAQLTPPALAATRDASQAPGLRFLTQSDYNAVVSTNLPFPHKRSPEHWR